MKSMKRKELLLESKAELVERARELDLAGRSRMSKEDLAAEIAKALTRAEAARARRTRKNAPSSTTRKATPAKALRAIQERSRKNRAAAEISANTAASAASDFGDAAASVNIEPEIAVAKKTSLRLRPSRAARRNEPPPGVENLDLDASSASSSSSVPVSRTPFKPVRVAEDRLTGGPLPKRYGRDKFVLLTRDPRWLFAYWEITEETEKKLLRKLGSDAENGSKILRVYDVTGRLDEDANDLFDLQIHQEANSWYIHLPAAGRAWRVELGIIGKSGRFYRIFGSVSVTTPRKSVSHIVDEEYRTLDEEFDEIFQLSGGKLVGSHLAGFGGSAVGGRRKPVKGEEQPEQYEWPFPTSGSLSSWHGGSSFSGVPPKSKDEFFFWVDCELILYGGTQPTANVTVQGHQVTLRPDGTFTLRYALPDGKIDLPAVAVRADGKERRKIEPIVTRRTIR